MKIPKQLWAAIAALAIAFLIQSILGTATRPKTVAYSEFINQIENDAITKVEIRADALHGTLKTGETIVTERLPEIDEPDLLGTLRDKDITFSGHIEKTSWWSSILLGWLMPFAIIFGLYSLFMKRIQKRGGPLSFGHSDAKIYDKSKSEQVSFQDVAGVDEAVDELAEVVDFLKQPEKYRSLGAHIPKGVLLVGPPGTGKTLLARAVAGEAEVSFFSMSGSEFVEMFVGVGAARMRSLFEQAKERAPCIVFLDELDAIGKSRGGLGAMATHDEREQTLNQLLVEMDGFDPGVGVVIMAATNRPEVLDAALVRAGRFDRQVLVDRPDIRGREEILMVHAKKITLANDVDLKVTARRTPGMVGADLANIVNEAALAAARRNSQHVGHQDFEEAIDRVQLGLKKKSRVMKEEEKRRVAVHESGHALVALSVAHADPVHRVTIVPRSIGALGVTLQLPTEDRYLMTREELMDQLCVMLAGRAAEALVCGEISTGAQNDLERATETARQMVCRFGMSEKLGAQTFGTPMGTQFLDAPVQLGESRNFSEHTAQRIDSEVAIVLAQQLDRAQAIVSEQRSALDAITTCLLDQETIDGEQLAAIVKADTIAKISKDGTPQVPTTVTMSSQPR